MKGEIGGFVWRGFSKAFGTASVGSSWPNRRDRERVGNEQEDCPGCVRGAKSSRHPGSRAIPQDQYCPYWPPG